MSVKDSLLALLSDGPAYGAKLRAEFDRHTGGVWPLNVGQVYTTLARLERDGLVVADGGPDAEGRIAYRLTPAGHAHVARWWASPVDRTEPARDELVMKLALAVATPDVDAHAVIQHQRTAAMAHLQRLTRAKLALSAPGSPPQTEPVPTPTSLSDEVVLEHRLYAVESELRWLDHVEGLLLHRRAPQSAPAPSVTLPSAASATAAPSAARPAPDPSTPISRPAAPDTRH